MPHLGTPGKGLLPQVVSFNLTAGQADLGSGALRCLPGFGFRAAQADHAARFVLGLPRAFLAESKLVAGRDGVMIRGARLRDQRNKGPFTWLQV
jgi:hypothetical protein